MRLRRFSRGKLSPDFCSVLEAGMQSPQPKALAGFRLNQDVNVDYFPAAGGIKRLQYCQLAIIVVAVYARIYWAISRFCIKVFSARYSAMMLS